MKKYKKASMQDIADAANVSIATVSRVLNKPDKVKQKTAEKILRITKKLNYHPDKVARRMRVKSSDALIFGLIITDIGNPFFSELSRGVEDIAYKNNHTVLIGNTDEDLEKENLYINTMLSEKVSGLILASTGGETGVLQDLISNGYPIVAVDRKLNTSNVDSVTIDNKLGAYEAVRHLIKLGHTRIGIVNGIKGLSNTEERYLGYKKALKESKLTFDRTLVQFENYKEAGGRRAMKILLELGNPPTSVFSTNNLMTLGCIEEIYNHNLSIPDDIAIVGFDDMSWSNALNPPLTAVKQPGYELGVNAAELLIKRLEDPTHNTVNIVLNPELIIRKSCGAQVL